MASNYDVINSSYFTRKSKYVFMRKDRLYDLNYADGF
jgi:hypothetical protein